MSRQKNVLSSLVSAALVATAIGTSANAADNPFTSFNAATGVQVVGMEGKCGEDKSNEGKCGSDKKTDDSADQETEGKCGEGKCGTGSMGDHEKPSEE